MSDEWLLHDGEVIATTLVLSHREQLVRLRRDSPLAAPRARIAGDIVLDQLVASLPRRASIRRAFGIDDHVTLVVMSSTWGRDSLLGVSPELPERFGALLPADEFRTVVVVHPNVWSKHSQWQVKQWLSGSARAGVTVLQDVDAWKAALVAADVAVVDHSSVGFYAAALGTPVLRATAPVHAVAADSPIGAFLRQAPRLDPGQDLPGQLRAAVRGHDPTRLAAITDQATSLPGNAAAALRELFYELLDLPAPAMEVDVVLPALPAAPLRGCHSHLVEVRMTGPRCARLVRYPADRLRVDERPVRALPLVVGPGETSRRWRELADAVIGEAGVDPRALLAEAPAAVLSAAPLIGPGGWLLAMRSGGLVEINAAGDMFAPVVLHSLGSGQHLDDLIGTWTLTAGGPSTEIVVGGP